MTSVTQGRVSEVYVDDGAVVEAGQPLLALDGRQAIAVMGDAPFFRPLDVGDKGEDVRQLEQVLADAGYSPGPIDTRLHRADALRAGAVAGASTAIRARSPSPRRPSACRSRRASGTRSGRAAARASSSAPPRRQRHPPGARRIRAGRPRTRGRRGAPSLAAFQPASRRFGNPGDPSLTIRSLNAVTAEGAPASFVIEASASSVSATDVTVAAQWDARARTTSWCPRS